MYKKFFSVFLLSLFLSIPLLLPNGYEQKIIYSQSGITALDKAADVPELPEGPDTVPNIELLINNTHQLTGVDKVSKYNDIILIDKSDEPMSIKDAVTINVNTPASNTSIDISDIKRVPVKYITLDKNMFLVNTPGKYWCDVTVIDFTKNIYDRKVVPFDVGGDVTPVDPDPIDPVDPDPTDPPSNYEAITKASKDGVTSLGDANTTVRLAEMFKLILNQDNIEDVTIAELQSQLSDSVEHVLLTRSKAERQYDWLNKWRLPVNEAISNANPDTTEKYIAAINAVLKGLK